MAHPAEGAPARSGALDPVFLWSSLALAVAAALRLYRLGQNSLWVDEYSSLVTARLSLTQIPAAALSHNAFEPPLYFWLLHVVIGVFGDSETALRLLSVVAGVLTVPLMVLLVRGIGESSRAASISAALLAVSPLHLWYSQEARPYALLVCLGVGSLVCLLRALQTGSTLAWAGFAGLAILAILAHVVGVVFPLVGWLWALRIRRDPSTLQRLLASSVLIALATAPFGYMLARAVLHAQGTGSPPRSLTGLEIPYTIFTYLAGYSFGPSVRDIQENGAVAALLAQPVQSALGVIALLALAAMVLRIRGRGAKELGLLFLLPMTITWLASAVTSKAYNVRYTLPGIIGFVGLVGLGIVGLRKQRVIATALIIGLMLWANAQWFFAPRYWKEDSRSAVAWLQGKLPPGSAVAVAPGYQRGVLVYYAQRAGADFVFDSLPEAASSLGSILPEALLVTRMHHLPYWKELVQSLYPRTGSPPPAVDLLGYRVFLAPK